MSQASDQSYSSFVKIATITEAKNRLSALIDWIRAGETVMIVDRGIPVARLEPAAGVREDAEGRLARLQRLGVVRCATGQTPVELIRRTPPSPQKGASALTALLEEREEGR